MNTCSEGNSGRGTWAEERRNNLVRDRNRKIAPLVTTMAEPLGLEMDANPVTKGAGLTAAESEQNIRHTERLGDPVDSLLRLS